MGFFFPGNQYFALNQQLFKTFWCQRSGEVVRGNHKTISSLSNYGAKKVKSLSAHKPMVSFPMECQ